MASEEELRRERELNDLFSRRAGINRDIVDDLQDQTNVLNDQIRLLKFEKSERSQIRSLTREVNKIASDNYNITVGELGVQKNLSKIRKDQLQLSKDLNSFTRLRNKLVNDGAKLNSDIVISLDDQIKFTKSLQVELQTVAELSNSIANNETVQRFSKIASFLKLLGPLKGFAVPFEKASEAARASIVANTEILKTGKGLTAEKAKELGIADKLNGIYGKVGLNAAKLTKTTKQQVIQSSARKAALKEAYKTSLDTVAIGAKILQSAFAVNKAQTQFIQLTGQSISQVDTLNIGLVTSVDYINQAVSATEQFGLNAAAIFSPDTLRAAAEFNSLMGFSAEEANSLALASSAFGGNLLDARKEAIEQVKAVNQSNKSVVSTKVALKDATTASKGLTVALGGSVSELTEAAAQARALGLSLSQMEKIADGLLDIETSIKNEFVAETILGRELNLERARLYAQTDQLAKLGKEIAANEGLVEGFIRGGRIERQAAADALGITTDELGQAILLQQSQLKLTDAQRASIQGLTEDQLLQQDLLTSINKSFDSITQTVAGVFAPAMATLAENAGLLKFAIGAIATLSLGRLIGQLVATAGQIAFIYGVSNPALLLGGLAAATLVVGGLTYLISKSANDVSQVGDGYADSSRGPFTVTDRFGATAITTPGDNLAVSPNVGLRGVNRNEASSMQLDYNKLADAIASGAERGTSKARLALNVDGRKFADNQQVPSVLGTYKFSS
jgi:enoyl-CoA hydratase/carnithine racemase